MSMLANNLEQITLDIQRVCQRCQRNPDEITLIAVSKTKPTSDVAELVQAGQRVFGENYLQEIKRKYTELEDRYNIDVTASKPTSQDQCCFHLIGHLQKNKAKAAASGMINLIHSLDSIELAQVLSKEAEKKRRVQNVLIQINISAQSSKSGCQPEDLMQVGQEIDQLKGLNLQGLMSIGSSWTPGATEETCRAEFRRMRELKSHLEEALERALPELSMGMSNDFEAAIEEGATMVRVGRSIFGERNG